MLQFYNTSICNIKTCVYQFCRGRVVHQIFLEVVDLKYFELNRSRNPWIITINCNWQYYSLFYSWKDYSSTLVKSKTPINRRQYLKKIKILNLEDKTILWCPDLTDISNHGLFTHIIVIALCTIYVFDFWFFVFWSWKLNQIM